MRALFSTLSRGCTRSAPLAPRHPLSINALMASRRLLSTTQLLRTTTTAGSNNQQRDGDPSSALVVGNTAVGVRDNHPYIYRRSELIGKLFPRMRPRSDAGDVLALLDVCAGRGAYFFLKTFKCGGRYRVENGLSMATISFNSFTFSQAIFEGDMLLFESRVIHTGNTTIGLHISVKRQAYDCPVPSYIGESYVTMVIVDANDLTKIVPGHIPAVRLTDPEDIKRHAKYNLLVQNAKALLAKQTHKHANLPAPDGIRSKRQLTVEEVELPQNATKPRKLSMRDTRIVCEQSFSNEHVNTNNAIFGGDILQFMEKAALHCGRVFAQYSRVFALGMMGMTFNSPIFLDDLVRCSAQVACVRGSTMLVNVRIDAEQEGKHRMTNQAAFILVSLDPEGVPVEIPCGINLEGATQAELGAYATARHIMEHSSKHRVKV